MGGHNLNWCNFNRNQSLTWSRRLRLLLQLDWHRLWITSGSYNVSNEKYTKIHVAGNVVSAEDTLLEKKNEKGEWICVLEVQLLHSSSSSFLFFSRNSSRSCVGMNLIRATIKQRRKFSENSSSEWASLRFLIRIRYQHFHFRIWKRLSISISRRVSISSRKSSSGKSNALESHLKDWNEYFFEMFGVSIFSVFQWFQ